MNNNNGSKQAENQKKETYLELEKELSPHFELMRKAAETVLDQDVSSYPIFVIHREGGIQLGIPLVTHSDEEGVPWSINLSTLEEFTTKKIIDIARVDRFQQVYKDPRDHFCLFLLKKEEANFVFL